MRKSAVIAITLIFFNLVLIWFDSMGFFNYQPEGQQVSLSGNINLFSMAALLLFLAGAGGVISKLTNINAFGIIMYMEIFWGPFVLTATTFNKLFTGSPAAFLGFYSIFFTICCFVFAYDIYEIMREVSIT